MKKNSLILFALFVCAWLPILTKAQTNSQLEREIFDEVNRVRANPAAYAQWLQDNRNNLPYQTLPDKKKVIDETIKVLRATAPLPILQTSPIAYKASKAHVDDQLPTGKFSHSGTDGSSVDQRLRRYGKLIGAYGENAITMPPDDNGFVDGKGIVLAWVIDDRVGSRAHRKILLDRNYLLTGVACAKYKSSKIYPDYTLCVMDYAQQLQ